MKLTALALLLLPTSILALNGDAASPHRLDRSSISRTQQKKDNLPNHLEGRQPCHGGGGSKKVEGTFLERFGGGGRGGPRKGPAASLPALWDQWMGKDSKKIYGEAEKAPMDSDLIYILPIDLSDALVTDVEVEIPDAPTELRTGHAHAHGHHHQHHHHKSSFAGRLDRAIDQLEPAEAAFLSFVFGFGFVSLFGMLFTITRRLVLRKRACKARRAAQAAAGLASPPPAYVDAAAAPATEKVAFKQASAAEEALVLLEHQ